MKILAALVVVTTLGVACSSQSGTDKQVTELRSQVAALQSALVTPTVTLTPTVELAASPTVTATEEPVSPTPVPPTPTSAPAAAVQPVVVQQQPQPMPIAPTPVPPAATPTQTDKPLLTASQVKSAATSRYAACLQAVWWTRASIDYVDYAGAGRWHVYSLGVEGSQRTFEVYFVEATNAWIAVSVPPGCPQ